MELAVLNLALEGQSTSAMNNAAWSTGEIAMAHKAGMEVFIPVLMSKLVPLLNSGTTPRSLKENSALTIGRLGLGCPEVVARYLEQFVERWYLIFLMKGAKL